ncbi:MAG: alpha/beta fold hydrolase [Salinarimonadaceae bacterium]|nr:MAG: alpha/beta fold hydrolase [Salinarimonadaceae bacterium]
MQPGAGLLQSFTASDGLRIAYRVDDFTKPWAGAETLVLLHSAMGCGRRFFSWIPDLAKHFRVVTPDLRGHGGSEIPSEDRPLTLARLVADVTELMDHVGAPRAHYVGTAAGGYLGQRIALDEPERVIRLSLFGSAPGLKQSQALSWIPIVQEKGLRGFLADTITDRFPIGQCDPELVEWFLDQAGANDPTYIARFITLMADQDWSDEVAQIRCPTMVVMPGLGKIGDHSAYEPMREIPDVVMTTYENTPNNVWDFAPSRCVADVIDFHAGASGRGRPAEANRKT